MQHIKNDFAVYVYEQHARIALANVTFSSSLLSYLMFDNVQNKQNKTKQGDMQEFTACLSRLIELYTEVEGSENVQEFTAYRILHALYCNSMEEVASIMAKLTPEESKAGPVAHALKVSLSFPSGWRGRSR